MFAPQDPITRAEFVQLLYNREGAPAVSGAAVRFDDVKEGAWYADAVDWAAETGLVKGTSETAFSPAANITRQDMAVILNSYVELVEKKPLKVKNDKQVFKDRERIAGYAAEAVTAMQTGGILNGVQAADGGFSFKPRDDATRAEAAKMIAALFQR